MEAIDKQTLTGKINRFLFQNENGWGIALFKSVDNSGQVKIKGNVGLLQPKITYELTGHFEENPKYGKSFEVESFQIVELKGTDQYLNFFKEMIPGVGEVVSKRIVEQYSGDDLFKEILADSSKLDLVKGLSVVSKKLLIEKLEELINENRFSTIFFNQGLKMDFLVTLKNDFHFKSDVDEIIDHILKNDFYYYAKQRRLTPFEEVDKVAMHFQKLEETNLIRLAWTLNYLIEEILNQTGNSYTFKETLYKKLKDYRGIFDQTLFENALKQALDLKLIFEENGHYFSDDSWNDELIIAKEISTRVNANLQNNLNWSEKEILTSIQAVEKEIQQEDHNPDFKYDEMQIEALMKFATSTFFVLTGGPGTGKTTVLKGMTKLYKKLKQNQFGQIAIATPTGRAASRINELGTSLRAKTIHKLLKATENGFFEVNQANPLEVELLIVDESSMIENKLFARLMESSSKVEKMVFIGDENQLPSVGYGEVFANLLTIKTIPQISLTTIHRQHEGNGIIQLAYKVLNNEIISEADFNLPNVYPIFHSQNFLTEIAEIFKTKINEKSDLTDLQVISPFYKGQIGINEINHLLQSTYQFEILKKNKINETDQSLNRLRATYYQQDKVMYLVNDSSIGLNNGDVGIIEQLRVNQHKLTHSKVIFNEEIKELNSDNFNNLMLSYACSVHKTQGSEYNDVFFVIEKDFNSFFLNRKLIYTAITRAKKNLYLIGDVKSLIMGIRKPAIPRKTGLIEKIYQFLAS